MKIVSVAPQTTSLRVEKVGKDGKDGPLTPPLSGEKISGKFLA